MGFNSGFKGSELKKCFHNQYAPFCNANAIFANNPAKFVHNIPLRMRYNSSRNGSKKYEYSNFLKNVSVQRIPHAQRKDIHKTAVVFSRFVVRRETASLRIRNTDTPSPVSHTL